jgi:hypothetical protein
MKNTTLTLGRFFFISALLISAFANADMPLFELTPLSPTTIQISALGTASVQYRVQNMSSKPHTLVMRPIFGITQVMSNGNCPSPFMLNPKQSCTLTLVITGSSLDGNVGYGPTVCQQGSDGKPSPLQCYQPSDDNSLKITRTTPVQYLYTGTENGNVYYLINNAGSWITTLQSPGGGSPVNSVFATNTTLYTGTL